MKCEFTAQTPINPTEDTDKVMKTLSNMFDYDEVVMAGDYISVNGGMDSLLKLKDALEVRRIRNTARKMLINGSYDGVIYFKLNKQAAFSGTVNFTEGDSPLGEIRVKIETDDVEGFIDWLAPLQK
ncbi:MAG TPA: RNA-binding domain-containing protein [Methanobacterium sp.]|jgi:hypothetical protein|nr:RNA-binding domain-containing protein [Methanobacterium sp.]